MKAIDFVLHKQMLPFFNQSPESREEKVRSLSTNGLCKQFGPRSGETFFEISDGILERIF